MSKPKVYVSRVIPKPALDMIDKNCEMDLNESDVPLTQTEFIEKMKTLDGLVCLLTDDINAEILQTVKKANPNFKVVSNVAVGYNNIDWRAATELGIAVSNTPGVLDDTTADFAWTLLMAVARRVVEADKYFRQKTWRGWGIMQFLGSDVYGKTLGIVGLGRIGRVVAKRTKGFDMKVLYTDIVRFEDLEKELGVQYVDKETLLRESDYVTLHVPLLPETTHYIGAKELEMMKETAYLINASRGPVVDEKALVKALKEKKIAGAGLDVFEMEPKAEPELYEMNNVVLVPHIASASIETRTKMATMAAENVIAGVKGLKPPNCVNPEIFG
ncbi:MAG: 2-hydroxyacid dehydrogenase [Promethearchaeota archaeon]